MKSIIVLAILFAIAYARPNEQDAAAHILKQASNVGPDGSYSYSHETSNGIVQNESGTLKQVPGATEPSIAVVGEYQYTGNDGVLYKITYTADENGYVPVGEHLPKA